MNRKVVMSLQNLSARGGSGSGTDDAELVGAGGDPNVGRAVFCLGAPPLLIGDTGTRLDSCSRLEPLFEDSLSNYVPS